MLCARCGQALRDGVKFCQKCGAKVEGARPRIGGRYCVKVRPCGNWGSAVTSNPKTCKWCGTDL